jgi:biotin carboxyl carrier protein
VKYYARVGNNEYVVDIEPDGVYVNGEPAAVDLKQAGGAELYSVLYNGRSHELLIEPGRYQYTITLRGEQYEVQVEDERTRRMSANRKLDLPEGEFAITAPIPGLVVKVLVREDEEISEEQPLLILEAMKMENEIRAKRPGVVKQVKVAPGQRVEQNAALLVIE